MDEKDFIGAVDSVLRSEAWAKRGKRLAFKPLFYREDDSEGLQGVHTPFALCHEIIAKLAEQVDLRKKRVAVLFNLEFVDVLIEDFKVPRKNITFFADTKREAHAAEAWYGVEVPGEVYVGSKANDDEGIWVVDSEHGEATKMTDYAKKFDVVVMNPPYQPPVKESEGGSGSRNVIWPEFVKLAIDLTENGGHIAAVHPTKWRKPEDEMFPLMTGQNLMHLEMHSKKDGIKMFGAMTPYDWYVMQKGKYGGKTDIKGTDGKRETIDLRDFSFLPNCDLERVANLLAKPGEEKCEVLFSRSAYGTDRPHMNETQTKKFCHPCIHTTGKGGVRYWYSSKREGFFDVPKLIFGEADIIANAIVDYKGEYGITQQAIAIPVSSKTEGDAMKKALESKAFNDLLQTALRWSQFRIDWRMFPHFRKDFWKEFI